MTDVDLAVHRVTPLGDEAGDPHLQGPAMGSLSGRVRRVILLVLVLAAVIACSGGFVVGYVAGRFHARVIADARRPLAPHEVLAQLRGPIGGPAA